MSKEAEGTAKRGVPSTWIDRQFHLAEHEVTVGTEILTGIIIFVIMTYVLGAVPNIMADAELDRGVMFTSMILLTIVTTVAIAPVTNHPFVLAPGLSSVAIASEMITSSGISSEVTVGVIFWSGVIFIVISYIDLRDTVVNAIPASLKHAVSSSVDLFIALLGCKNAGLIIALEGKNSLAFDDLSFPSVPLALIRFLLTLITKRMQAPGYIIFSILTAMLVGIPVELTRMPEAFSITPSPLFGRFARIDFLGTLQFAYLSFLTAMFVPNFFSAFGTALDVGVKAGFLDEDGNLFGIDKMPKVDVMATALGSLFYMLCMTIYLESSFGVEAGRKTRLAPISASVRFTFILLLTPFALMIPSVVTTPTLIIIEVGMLSSMRNTNYDDFTESLPTFIRVAFTIFASNIVNGICVALSVYMVLKLAPGKVKEMPKVIYILLGVCVLYFYGIVKQFM